MNSELRARLARLAPVPDENPAPSFSEGRVVILTRDGALDRPIDVLRRLRAVGVSLRAAHQALNRLAEAGSAVCTIDPEADLPALARDLAALGITLRLRRTETRPPIDIAAIRARHALSQREFAALLGFELRTLQNWEQGRNAPEEAALALITLFERDPKWIEEAFSDAVPAREVENSASG
ncbi:helix-turn-helix domain-containing protein [Acidibrevibacterium fodinaquatile]|uniref:helix-turn-helix domain-containing protein n=1 Tax=Acidibrevibacterium fodinaquatile TaxID=1969806 RepID=UPI000E0D71E3|nr:helix-turn-helix domain-containing protein [Acidibrevibacterium fodinaquatile]